MIAYNDCAVRAPQLRTFCKAFKDACVSYLELKKGNSDVMLSGVELLDKADAILEGLEKKEASIATDSRLSAVGKQEQMATMTKAFHQQLAFIAQAATDRRNAAEQLRRTFMAAPPATTNETVDFLRSTEIRQRLVPMSMADRMKIVANGDSQVIRAVMMDPLGEPLVDSEFLERLQQQKAQATDGRQWVRMESLEFVAERLTQLATAIDLQLSNYNAMPAFTGKPTRTTDLAYTDTTAAPSKAPSVDTPPANVPAFQ